MLLSTDKMYYQAWMQIIQMSIILEINHWIQDYIGESTAIGGIYKKKYIGKYEAIHKMYKAFYVQKLSVTSLQTCFKYT